LFYFCVLDESLTNINDSNLKKVDVEKNDNLNNPELNKKLVILDTLLSADEKKDSKY
jgi:hypothetical protein